MTASASKSVEWLTLKEASSLFVSGPHVRTLGRWAKVGIRRWDGSGGKIKLKTRREGMYFWTCSEWIEKFKRECEANIPPVKKN